MRREFSAGGVVFRRVKGGVEWLIRRPAPSLGYRGNLGWGFPKGWIDDDPSGGPGEAARGAVRAEEGDLERAALREVREEGGVEARIVKKLRTIKVIFTDQKGERVMKFITYYLMEYLRDVPEGHDEETEEKRWVGEEEAVLLLAFENERKLLREASKET